MRLPCAIAIVTCTIGACADPLDAVPSGDDSSDDGGTSAGDDAPAATSTPVDDDGDGSGSSGEPVDPSGPWDHGYAIPEGEQVPGDVEAGYWALLNEGYVTCGIPYDLFQLGKTFLGAFADGEPWPGRTGKNAEVPYNWTVHIAPSGNEIVSLNCLECHVGSFNGELVMGLGKADADYTGNFGEALGGFPIEPLPGMEELAEMAAR